MVYGSHSATGGDASLEFRYAMLLLYTVYSAHVRLKLKEHVLLCVCVCVYESVSP